MRPLIFVVLSALVLLLTACSAPALTIPQDPLALSRTFVALNAAKQDLTETLIAAGAHVRGRAPDAPETAADLPAVDAATAPTPSPVRSNGSTVSWT